MLTNANPWVLCEWHTDFICSGPNGDPPNCLVSVKHREPDQGPWLLSDMAGKGGLAVLYRRWKESGRKHSCRWVTNAGLRLGDLQTRSLSNLLSVRGSDFESSIKYYAEYLQNGIAAETLADAIGFLASLTIFSTGGDARSFRAQIIDEVARPILEQLGARPGRARAAYQAVHGLVLEAVQGLDPHTCNVTWYSGDEAVSSDVSRRKITRERLAQCLADNGIAVPRESMPAPNGRETKMIRKLRAGGIGPTVLSVAPRIRQQWYELEICMRPDIPSLYGDELDRIRAEVGVCAGEGRVEASDPGETLRRSNAS
jgi:hypothetical protein